MKYFRFLIPIYFILIGFQLHSQSWVTMMQDPTANFYDIQAAFNSYWQGKTIEKGKGYNAFRRWEAYMEPRVYPSGNTTLPSQNAQNYKQWEADMAAAGIVKSVAGNWTLMGPVGKPVGSGAGRLNFIRIHPTIANTIYVGAANGGLWKTTNGGGNWTTNTDLLGIIGSSDIAFDPSNPSIMYLATGDSDGGSCYSIGVLKSIDAGATWQTTGLTWNASNGIRIAKILINPINPQIVMAFGSSGIYRSTNGGTTWTQPSGTFTGIKDAEINPGDPTILYAAGTSFKRSTDSGLTWTTIPTGLTNISRLAIGVTPANNAYVYVLAANNIDEGFLALIQSIDNGASFTTRSTTPNILGYSNGGDAGGQGSYDLAIGVSPTNDQEVMVGGINMWKSSDAGITWDLNSHWSGYFNKPYVHADIHDIVYLNGTTIYSANDGGINKSIDGGASWTDRSANLAIAQQYRLGLSTSNPNLIIAGHQDNGTNRYNGTNWNKLYGGDGMDCFIDRTNDNIMVWSIQNGSYYRSTNGGSSCTSINNGIPAGAFLSVIHQDPITTNTYYAGGRAELYKTTNSGTTWTALGTPSGSGNIARFAIAPSNNQVIYALKYGANGISRSTNGGTSFTTVSAGLPTTATPTDITVSNTNANVAIVTLSGYNATNKVFKTTNGGITWTNLSAGLPNIPVNCVVYNNNSAINAFYIGTDLGVFYRDNNQSTWVAFNTGLPNVSISDLEIYYPTARLRAATYGRGTWDSDLYTVLPQIPVANLEANSTTLCSGNSITFSSTSSGIPTSFAWSFPGGTPSTSTNASENVTYANPGSYDATLIATNSQGSDTLTITNYITVLSGSGQPIPLTEGFVNATFPPTNWLLYNLDGNMVTWQRTANVGVLPTAGNAMFFDNYTNDDRGNQDEVWTPRLNFSGLLNAKLTFDVAHGPRYMTGMLNMDGLEVLVSNDCGATFTSVYSKSGILLATAPPSNAYFTPTTGQWRNDTIDLSQYIAQENIIIAFRNLAEYSNNIYLDNINIIGDPIPLPPTANFTFSPNSPICAGDSVYFQNTSLGEAGTVDWTFNGGIPPTSTLNNPVVVFNNVGIYSTNLIVTNSLGIDSIEIQNIVTVNEIPVIDLIGDQITCLDAFTNAIVFSGSSNVSTYSWTNTNPSIGLAASGVGTINSFLAQAAGAGIITVAPTLYNCVGLPTEFTITIQDCANLAEISASNLLIYPNPSSITLSVLSLNGQLFDEIKLFDMMGRRVFIYKMKNMSQHTFDVKAFSSGYYYIEIDGKELHERKELIINN